MYRDIAVHCYVMKSNEWFSLVARKGVKKMTRAAGLTANVSAARSAVGAVHAAK